MGMGDNKPISAKTIRTSPEAGKVFRRGAHKRADNVAKRCRRHAPVCLLRVAASVRYSLSRLFLSMYFNQPIKAKAAVRASRARKSIIYFFGLQTMVGTSVNPNELKTMLF